jgi:hypothetical protein
MRAELEKLNPNTKAVEKYVHPLETKGGEADKQIERRPIRLD